MTNKSNLFLFRVSHNCKYNVNMLLFLFLKDTVEISEVLLHSISDRFSIFCNLLFESDLTPKGENLFTA